MKNLPIKMKMIIGFTTVIILAMVVGIVGIVGMYRINAADDALYNENYLPTVMAGHISKAFIEQRMYMRNFIIYDVNEDAAEFKSSESALNALKTKIDGLLDDYYYTMTEPEDKAAYSSLVSTYEDEWLPIVEQVRSLGAANRSSEAAAALAAGAPVASKLEELAETLQNINIGYGEQAVKANTGLYRDVLVVESVLLAFTLGLSLFFEIHVSHLIRYPLEALSRFMRRAGTTGDISVDGNEKALLNKFAQYRDEVGQCIGDTITFLRHVIVISDNLEAVADGDLTVDVKLLSEKDVMGKSVKKMVDGLNGMFGEINSSTSQVSAGAKQVADGSQILAHGATEQAAAVEELSSSISQITEQTRENAQMASDAAKLAGKIMGNAEKGSAQMESMTEAVREINQASQNISRVIKVIDDIAFQTNILALNAAVEAARAGQHGKGFAVVAEEVRNLAAKSAAAAKDTGALITNSMDKAELGARIAHETAESLAEIVSGINESNKIVADIARSSEDQSAGISMLNTGIEQVSQVIQSNSATAEQSSAASEEMSHQAAVLEGLVAQFKLKEGNTAYRGLPSAANQSRPLGLPGRAGY